MGNWLQAVDPSSRIVGGQQARVGQFPWHALFAVQYYNDNTNKIVYCGGAILNEHWVITTADCVKNARTIYADLGSISSKRPLYRAWPSYYVLHPQHKPEKFQNNIALVHFATPIPFPQKPNPEIRPIRLPRLSQRNELFVNAESYYAGFGFNSPSNSPSIASFYYVFYQFAFLSWIYVAASNISEVLLFSEARVISNQVCRGYFNNDASLVNNDVACALSVDGRQGACLGDGGTSLFINDFGEWTLIGTLSFLHSQHSCGRAPTPAGFARITSYFDWIGKTANYSFRP